MNNHPILSIVTVTKNCGDTILKTLKSILEIKTKEIEYIVIDGLSSDKTLDYLEQYMTIIDFLKTEADSGVYDAMNKGVRLASGRYVLFINGDDQIIGNNFNAVMTYLEFGSADVYCSKTLTIDSNGDKELLGANKWLLPFYNSVPHPSSFIRRQLLVQYPFRIDLKIASDYDVFLKFFLMGKVFKNINVVTALHSRGGISSDSQKSTIEINKIRRQNLGIFIYLFNALMIVNRLLKRLLRLIK
jgi:glycosyltransferase involved in cell wall biosynthesis